ncbi:unnamed protein product [Rotaria sordida]|uniref:Uncharacterized protein n=1 Tax=Rotaria sordida TaxID=392033 RepID=A0A818ZXE7_9BILA|nr:unnamed protein product [Rotaria sordida]
MIIVIYYVVDSLKRNRFSLITPLRAPAVAIHPNARWQQDGITVGGRNEDPDFFDPFDKLYGLYVYDDQTIYVAEARKHQIMEWKSGRTWGKVVAGGTGKGNEAHQLNWPTDVIVDKKRDSLIICDRENRRVVRWPRRNSTSGETIISNIACAYLTMDESGSLYVVDRDKDEVRRYIIDDVEGTVVAGGNGKGNRLDQLSEPTFVFVDRNHSVYVSDKENHRVMKWMEGAKQGIVVAGGQGEGNGLTQLSHPLGVVVDQLGTVYVAARDNNRIMRWPKGATQGSVIIDGNGDKERPNQFCTPVGLSFGPLGDLYVVDHENDRVRKFSLIE